MSSLESNISHDKVYDYIICGGGTAGCVVAGRLAENPELSILVVEAGTTNDAYPAAAIPAASWERRLIGMSRLNLCKELDNRQLHLARGKYVPPKLQTHGSKINSSGRFLGGTSGCNGTLAIRGNRQDYDNWGLEGWSGDEFFQYMSKAETLRNKPWFTANEAAHGHNGPVVTAPHDPAPISNLILESYQSMGLPLIPDMFGTGIRTIAADYITKSNTKGNIFIQTKSYVDRINLEKDDSAGLRANGVYLQDADDHKIFVRARKEVIVTAGAYGSPAILLRSGIGAAQEVEKLGIKSQVDFPGVGKNLMDHLVVFSFYGIFKSNTTHDRHIWHTGGKDKSFTQYKAEKIGFFSQFPFGIFAFACLNNRLADSELWQNAKRSEGLDPMGLLPTQPHVEFWNTECYSLKYMFKDFPADGQYAFAMASEFFAPRSRGDVSVKSTDPTSNPVVNHNYLNDPLDMLVFSEACRLGNEIATQGAGTKDIVVGSWPRSLNHHKFTTREEWEPVISSHRFLLIHLLISQISGYHLAGTCKMGNSDDAMAVLDEKLRVQGVGGLRVADASIMPTLIGGHPQMPVYGIGEKAAGLIKADN